MQILDPNDPFFRPAWKRWVTACVPLAWACVEAYSGNHEWALLFAAMGAFAYWRLILTRPDGKGSDGKGPDDNKPDDTP